MEKAKTPPKEPKRKERKLWPPKGHPDTALEIYVMEDSDDDSPSKCEKLTSVKPIIVSKEDNRCVIMDAPEKRYMTETQDSGESTAKRENWTSVKPIIVSKEDNRCVIMDAPEKIHTTETQAASNKSEKKLIDDVKFRKFVGWLQGAPYLKNARESYQHAQQVFTIFHMIGDGQKIEDLYSEDLIRTTWMNKWLEIRQPGTIRSYLSSLNLFYEFSIMTGKEKNRESGIYAVQQSMKVYSKALRKRVCIRRTVVETEEIETMLEPLDVKEFLQSNVAKRAEAILADENSKVLDHKELLLARDYLLFRLIQVNGQRPGSVKNLMLKNIENAKITAEGVVVMIAQHKTAAPLSLGMTRLLFNYFKRYVKLIQLLPNFIDGPNARVFLNLKDDLTEMTSSDINKRIQKLWSEGPSTTKITATRMRKAISTSVRTEHPESREMLAAHMNHLPGTADRYYALQNRRRNAVAMSNMISDVMENRKGVQKSVHWPKEGSLQVQLGEEAQSITEPMQAIEAEPLMTNPNPRKAIDVPVPIPNEIPTHRRRSFTQKEAEQLISLTADVKCLKQDSIIGKLQETSEGLVLLLTLKDKLGEEFKKKITDRIRTQRRASYDK